MRMLALMKYGDRAASTRQRLLQYNEYLSNEGIEITYLPLLSNDYLDRVYSGDTVSVFFILKAYLRRLKALMETNSFDMIWVHCESFPYLPGLFERLILITHKPVVYDFDDAIFHQYDSHPNSMVRFFLGKKLHPLLRGASLCLNGNAYLKAYTDPFARRSEIIPTVLDTSIYTPSRQQRVATQPITIGWIGSPSTWVFVRPYIPLLERLSKELNLHVRIVGAGRVSPTSPQIELLDWSEDREIALIQGMDIGIMPLPDEPWARGKCGYKLIQYMACAIPVIASPVGVNSDIVDEGVNGYLAHDESQWEAAIRRLASCAELRAGMGSSGREKIVREYSLHVHGPRLASLLREVTGSA